MLSEYQEPKYGIRDNKLTSRQTGHPVPDDEPVFILRARDPYAQRAIMAYHDLVPKESTEHREAVKTRAAQFANWAALHPDRMKEPDTTITQGFTSAGNPPPAK